MKKIPNFFLKYPSFASIFSASKILRDLCRVARYEKRMALYYTLLKKKKGFFQKKTKRKKKGGTVQVFSKSRTQFHQFNNFHQSAKTFHSR